MKPLTLELVGFKGIRSGLGKDRVFIDLTKIPEHAKLVAITGPNGAGKTTIMDNLPPYRVMPSKSSTLGPGGFSYWEEIEGVSAKKDAVWEHAGSKFRSLFNFKRSGKSEKADYYLFQWNEQLKDWVPAVASDGIKSDGKSSSYDHCLNEILGSPEKFFTAQFSAQERKTLDRYAVGDIKSLLAEMLMLGKYQRLAKKASVVWDFLKAQLDGLQDTLAQIRVADAGMESVNANLVDLDQAIKVSIEGENNELDRLAAARKSLTLLEAKRDALVKNEEERQFLSEQIQKVQKAGETRKAEVAEQSKIEQQRLKEETARAETYVKSANASLTKLNAEILRLQELLKKKELVCKATLDLPRKKEVHASLTAEIRAQQLKLSGMVDVKEALQEKVRSHSALLADGKAKAKANELLEKTAALISEVPCHGSDLQKSCPLLAQANDAQKSLAKETIVLHDLRQSYKSVGKEVAELESRVKIFAEVQEKIKTLMDEREAVSVEMQSLSETAAMQSLLEEAERRLPEATEEREKVQSALVAATTDVQCAATKLENAMSAFKKSMDAIDTETSGELKTYRDRIEQLMAPVTATELAAAKSVVETCANAVERARAKTLSMGNQRVGLLAKLEAFKAIKLEAQAAQQQATRLQDEMAKWKLIEKGMGNDGLIALSIDDSGPVIASICNDILSECYGSRFAVRIDTQRMNKSGTLKETFEIVVFDNHRGDPKALEKMSGGERVWVNECLTRAIALYVGQTSGIQYETLFADETDGALDENRKREFMAMKRAVLARGGYGREYFITHTPELQMMADYQIDVMTL